MTNISEQEIEELLSLPSTKQEDLACVNFSLEPLLEKVKEKIVIPSYYLYENTIYEIKNRINDVLTEDMAEEILNHAWRMLNCPIILIFKNEESQKEGLNIWIRGANKSFSKSSIDRIGNIAIYFEVYGAIGKSKVYSLEEYVKELIKIYKLRNFGIIEMRRD